MGVDLLGRNCYPTPAYHCVGWHVVVCYGGPEWFRIAGADNAAWTSLGLARLSPYMFDHFSSISLTIGDEGSFEILVPPGLIVDVVQAAFQVPWIDLYEGFDLEEDTQIKLHRREALVNACKEWEKYVQRFPPDRDPYEKTCGRYEAFWRTLIADRDFSWRGPPPVEWDYAGQFEAWMGRRKPMIHHEAYIRMFNKAAVPRCMYRSFLITAKGYLGLGSRNTQPSDLICVLRGGTVPLTLRQRGDGYHELVGEAYVHGIMDGNFVREGAKGVLHSLKRQQSRRAATGHFRLSQAVA
jgi:hypothetical protein